MTTKPHTFPPLKPLPLITLEQYEVIELNQDLGYNGGKGEIIFKG